MRSTVLLVFATLATGETLRPNSLTVSGASLPFSGTWHPEVSIASTDPSGATPTVLSRFCVLSGNVDVNIALDHGATKALLTPEAGGSGTKYGAGTATLSAGCYQNAVG